MQNSKTVIGWREWVRLPELPIKLLKAKVDTGAKTSVLHAFFLEPFIDKNGINKIRFKVHPFQRRTDKEVVCEAPIVDYRLVTDSGGHSEKRYVIQTPIILGDKTFPIEISLTDRDTLKFRMLLGRSALYHRFVIDAEQSYFLGKPKHPERILIK